MASATPRGSVIAVRGSVVDVFFPEWVPPLARAGGADLLHRLRPHDLERSTSRRPPSASVVLSRQRAAQGFYPAVDPLQPQIVGKRHFWIARAGAEREHPNRLWFGLGMVGMAMGAFLGRWLDGLGASYRMLFGRCLIRSLLTLSAFYRPVLGQDWQRSCSVSPLPVFSSSGE